MATITTRAGKGSPLTNTEVDDNFSNLNSAKYESGASPTFANSALLNSATTVSFTLDGASANSKNIYFKGDSSAQMGRIASIGTSLYFQLTDATNYFTINPGSTVINDSSVDHDFRVESNDLSHMLFVDANTNRIGIGQSIPDERLHVIDNSNSALMPFVIGNEDHTDNSTSQQVRMGFGLSRDSGTVKNNAGMIAVGKNLAWTSDDANIDSFMGLSIFKNNTSTETMRIEPDKVRLGNASDYAMVDVSASNAAIQLVDNNQANPPTIRGNGPNFTLENQGYNRIAMYSGSTVVNDDSRDQDFRVESDSNTHALFVDAGSGHVNINTSADIGAVLNISGDIAQDYGASRKTYRGKFISYRGASDGTYYGYILLVPYHSGAATAGAAMEGTFIASRGNSGTGNGPCRAQVWASAVYTSTVAWFKREGAPQSFIRLVRVTYDSVEYIALKMSNVNGGMNNGIYYDGWSIRADDNFLFMALSNEISNEVDYDKPLPYHSLTHPNQDQIFENSVTFNEAGADKDFRVESDGNANMLFVDGGNNRVGIGTNFPSYEFVISKDGSSGIEFGPEGINSTTSFIQFYNRSTAAYDTARFYGSAYEWYLNGTQTGMTLSTSSLVVNESGVDSDFRVESDNNSHMLFVDAGANCVGIGTSAPDKPLVVKDDAPTGNTTIKIHNNSASHAAALELRGERTSTTADIGQLKFNNGTKNVAQVRSSTDGATNNGTLEFWTATSSANVVRRWFVNNAGNFIPGSNDAYDIGSPTSHVRNVYTGDLHLSNQSKSEGNEVDGTKGSWTVQEGADHLYLINRTNGKKYRFALEEIE